MKFKKLFASALAIALAATIIPATPAKADITATGGATFVNTEVYDVKLPTTASQKFYLDPQGLAVVATNGSGKGELPTTGAGIIVGKEKMQIINNSSRPVDVKVDYLLDTDENEVKLVLMDNSGSAITDLTEADAATNTKPAICLTVNATNIKALAVTAGATTLAQGATNSIAANSTSAIDAGKDVEQTYSLEDADYVAEFKGSNPTDFDEVHDSSKYEYKMVTSGAALDLEIGGVCNKYGDYSAFTGATPTKLDLMMTFKLYKVGTADEVDAAAGPTPINVTMSSGKALTLVAANITKAVSKVTVGSVDASPVNTGRYTTDKNPSGFTRVTLDTTWVGNNIANVPLSVYVVFTDGTYQEFKVS